MHNKMPRSVLPATLMDEQNKPYKKFDLFLIALILISITAFLIQVYFVSQVKYVSDTAYYAEVAENILKSKGFTLDFVDEFFVKFSAVTHPEEWGFPMMSIITVPFIYFFGKTPLATKLPIMIIGTILFPILVYYLGKEFFDEKIGFLSAISILFYAPMFAATIGGRRDIPFAFFALVAIYFFYRGLKEDRVRYFYLMGLFLGISYLVRQTALIIVPVLLLAHYLIKKKINFNFVKGILVAGLVMVPWLIWNYLTFGDPLFSANRYAEWIFGWFPVYEQIGYNVFWDVPKPSLSWLLSYPLPGFLQYRIIPKILNGFALQFETLLILSLTAFVGLVITSLEKIKESLLIFGVSLSVFIMALATLIDTNIINIQTFYPLFQILFIIPFLVILWVVNVNLGGVSNKNRIFSLFWLVFILFHAIYVHPDLRFLFPIIVFFFIFSWAGVKNILKLASIHYIKLKKINIEKILSVILIIFLLISIPQTFGNFFNKDATFPYKDPERAVNEIGMAELIASATEKDAVIMACNVPILHFYSNRKLVELPSDTIENIVKVIKAYNVSYISFAGCERREIGKKLYYGIFWKESTFQLYEKVLYKINLNETFFDTIPVAWIDKGGKRIVLNK